MTGKAISALDSLLGKDKEPGHEGKPVVPSHFEGHPTLRMKAVEWRGKKNIQVHEVPRPVVTDPVSPPGVFGGCLPSPAPGSSRPSSFGLSRVMKGPLSFLSFSMERC